MLNFKYLAATLFVMILILSLTLLLMPLDDDVVVNHTPFEVDIPELEQRDAYDEWLEYSRLRQNQDKWDEWMNGVDPNVKRVGEKREDETAW